MHACQKFIFHEKRFEPFMIMHLLMVKELLHVYGL